MYKFQLPPTAHPVQLLNINENDGEIQFNQKVVNDLFMNPKLSDANVVIFSIVGAFRKGKSFLLNYILRYLYANYESVSNANLINPDNWLGDAKEPLTGFPWKSGTDRDTTGLVLWSDVFLFDKPNGEKIAIYLMDTQGLFGNQTTKSDDSRIFSLSTLISSVQIFNLFNNIQEDQLEFLYLATELAKHASESKINSKSFQNLLILIRDWNNPEEQSCDFDGGNQYLNKLLEVNDHQKPELKFVRNYLRSAFESINCFLMPHPGKTVARDSKYDGNWEHMDEDFLMSMNELLPELLSPNKLKTKVVNGKAIKPAELLIFIKTYIEHFKSGEIPEPQPKYEATLAKICKDVTTNQQAELMNANDLKTEMKIDNNYEGSIDATIGKKSCPVEAIKDDRLLGSQSIEAERAVFTVPHDAHPIDLINFKNETEKLKLNLETLETLFLDDLVADRNAVVISIVGAFRTGKSFLLNYFLRFMYANYRSTRNPNATFNKDENLKNWLEDEHEMLKGFPWKCSKKKGTVCIKFWSDVFLFDDETNGEKIAIYLMDTEGLFEHGSLSADNARILSFSTFISSVQIINLLNIIQENDLKYLKFVTESAKLAGTGNIGKDGDSYQNLMFLIRDWNSLLDYEYGLDGGEKFLENFLKIRDFHITTELESIRQYLKSSFDEINCFLMPYPGKIVARSQSYDGRLSNIDEDFVGAMEQLFHLLTPANLKTVHHKKNVKARELPNYIKCYFESYKPTENLMKKEQYESKLQSYKRTDKNDDKLTTDEEEQSSKKLKEDERVLKKLTRNDDSTSNVQFQFLNNKCEDVNYFKQEEFKKSELKEQIIKKIQMSEANRNTEELNKQKEELEKQKKLKQIDNEKYKHENQLIILKLELESKRKIEAENSKMFQEERIRTDQFMKNFHEQQNLIRAAEAESRKAMNEFSANKTKYLLNECEEKMKTLEKQIKQTADRAERAEARMQSDQILQTQAINLLKPSRTHSNCTIA